MRSWKQAHRAAVPRMIEGVTFNAQRSTFNAQVMDEVGVVIGWMAGSGFCAEHREDWGRGRPRPRQRTVPGLGGRADARPSPLRQVVRSTGRGKRQLALDFVLILILILILIFTGF